MILPEGLELKVKRVLLRYLHSLLWILLRIADLPFVLYYLILEVLV